MQFKVTNNTPYYYSGMKEAAANALTQCGMTAEAYAKKLCPVDTGNLRNSITYTVDTDDLVAYIGTNVEYGVYVEMGTVKMKAQPYLKPAVSDHNSEYNSIIKTTLKNA